MFQGNFMLVKLTFYECYTIFFFLYNDVIVKRLQNINFSDQKYPKNNILYYLIFRKRFKNNVFSFRPRCIIITKRTDDTTCYYTLLGMVPIWWRSFLFLYDDVQNKVVNKILPRRVIYIQVSTYTTITIYVARTKIKDGTMLVLRNHAVHSYHRNVSFFSIL